MEEKKNIKNKWLHVRLDEKQYLKIKEQFSKTTERKLSAYARNILLGKPMIKAVRNQSLQEVLIELIQLRKDLSGLTNNYNQMVHKLHLLSRIPEFHLWVKQYEFEKVHLMRSVDIIKEFIAKAEAKWLQ